MPRKILHVDLDAFFCAVEERRDPSLRGKPFAVGGRAEARGVVSSCSYPARHMGIRSAMPMAHAIRLCPSLLVFAPKIQIYSETSRQVMELLDGFSGRIEQVSVDEAFLDLSDVADDGETLARRIQACIRDRLDLPCSIGVATNKLVAKIATDVGKKAAPDHTRPPYAITVVPAGEEAAFLAPLPADMLWGVGPKTASRLASLGMHTIGDIAAWPERELHARFGEAGLEIARHARGQDARPVATGRDVKSISQEVTFARDLRDDRDLDRTLRDLSADVGRRLRRADLAGNTVKIKIRWPDFTTLSRQSRLLQATDQDDEIFETAVQLLRKVRPAGKAVRLVGVGVSGLAAPTRQLSLWDDGSEKSRRLLTVLDELRQKYGEQAIQRGGMDDTRRAEHGWLHHRRSEEEA